MAYDIGPKIGIDGEAEFRSQINQITTQLKTLGSEMQVVTSEFGKNQDSEEALTAKNKVLQKEIDVQKTKLEQLNIGLQKSKDLYGENDSKTLKWQQTVNKATADLNKMQNELKDNMSSLDKLKESVDDVGEEFKDAGNKAVGFGDILGANIVADGVTGALSSIKSLIGDVAKEIWNFSSESQNAITKATAYFGETGQAAEDTSAVIKDVFSSGVGDSMDQVSDAVITVKSNLKDLSETDMTNITNQAVTMESLYGVDMNETLRGVNSLMEQFGIDAQTAMDYVVSGTQNGLDKTNELGDNLSEYAGKFSQAGYSASDYFQLLNNGLDGGAYNLDKVNDAINEVTTRLADGTISKSIGSYSDKTKSLFTEWQNGGATQKQVIDSIVSDIQSTTSQQDALNLAATAFGTMAEDGNLKFITSLSSVGDTYTNVQGKAQTFFDSTTTPQQEFQAALRTAEEELSPIGDQLMSFATDLIPGITQGIKDFAGFMQENGPTVASTIGAIGAGFVAWNIVSMMSGVIGIIKGTTTATTVLNATVAANPIMLIVTLIAMLISYLVVLYNTNETFRDGVNKVFGDIGSALSSVGSGLKTFFTQTIPDGLSSAGSSISSWWDGLVTDVKNLPSTAEGWAKDMLDGFIAGIKKKIQAIKDAAGDIAKSIKSFLHFSRPDEGPLRNYETWMPDFMDGMATGIYDNKYKVTDAIKNLSTDMQVNLNGAASAKAGNTKLYNVTQVYLGNKQLASELAGGVVKKITSNQVNKFAAKGVTMA
jgi:phage-related minor tail protein